jgi:glutathione synthase/RimK-type ligase-like ATP-grasp enzyme
MRLLLLSPKNVYATKRLALESRGLGIQLTTIDIAELMLQNYDIDPADFDALYIRQAYVDFKHQASDDHLQQIIGLAQRFKSLKKVVADESIAEGDLGAGKYEALLRLQEQGTNVPKTRLLNEAFGLNFSSSDQDIAKERLWQDLDFPFIAKWNYGFGARHTYLVKSMDDLQQIERKYPAAEILIQEFVPGEFEYKVITVGYKSLPVILKLKTNHNKFLPDLKQYEVLSQDNASPELLRLMDLAEKSAKTLQRELAKVDILQAGEQLYVLEVNRWPGLQYFEKATKHNVAEEFLRYIAKKTGLPYN